MNFANAQDLCAEEKSASGKKLLPKIFKPCPPNDFCTGISRCISELSTPNRVIRKGRWISESVASSAFHMVKRKKPGRLWTAGLYKGWVSKHNPYTILKRNSAIKKYLHKIFGSGKKILTPYPHVNFRVIKVTANEWYEVLL